MSELADDTTAGDAAPTIRARDDVDGCGCLECRNIETVTTRRTALDALVWSLRLFRSRPSIVAFAGVGIVANRLLETDSINMLPTPVVGLFDVITAFAFVFLIRAYVGTIVAGELTGDTVAIREGLHRTSTRIPALVGAIVLFILSVMAIPFLVSLPLLVLVGVVPGNPVEVVGFPVVGAISVVVVTVPFLLLLFKFWFVPEACVIGQYGPVEALRISWHVTTNYRGKFVLILIIAIGSAISFYLPTYLPEMGTKLGGLHPVLSVISASFGEFLSIVWASAYAHIYVQGVVS
ncbi:hypothetical protein [Halostagnicola kamekurae]|uniref:DUF7847 domain-containing protein n=1 Tax=Halostagnicola kamekurae TaxID=619731 RepID=A0A1I6P7Q3_9EURY|nr:hypothetical protein [Halostagnicola kamekurae]SFS36223.1 hypothetical protein SAMN04488556_0378 [Halostagnicola kamekurae]